jgi:hypothetical protein
MSAKGTKSAPSPAVASVNYILQAAALNSYGLVAEDLKRKTEFDESFSSNEKPLDILGPKGKILCSEIINKFVEEMRHSEPQTQMMYQFLKDLPDRLYSNTDLCTAMFRNHRTSDNVKFMNLNKTIASKREIFTNCFAEESFKQEAIFMLVEGLAALFWTICGSSLTAISNNVQFKVAMLDLVARGIIPSIDSNIYRYFSVLSDKVKPSEGVKKPGTKKVAGTLVQESNAACEDAAAILGLL